MKTFCLCRERTSTSLLQQTWRWDTASVITDYLLFYPSQSHLFHLSQDLCHNAALGIFIKEFEKARKNCKDKDEHVVQTMEALQAVGSSHSAKVSTEKLVWISSACRQLVSCVPQTQTECTLTTDVHQSFADFVSAAKEFAERFNSAQSQRLTHWG